MGQQQLLLLVLGIVIVGLAVVVGIQAFSENQVKANSDAMVNDGVRIASDVQAWALKPAAFGGNGGWDGTAPGFNDIGYSTNTNGDYKNLNGTYTVDGTTDCSGGAMSADVYIAGTNADTGNSVCIGVSGTGPEDIETQVTIGT